MKSLFAFVALLLMATISFYHFYQSSAEKEFRKIADQGGLLDFGNINSVEWDHAILVTPYETHCFESGECISSTDDNECYFVLAKNKEFVESIRVHETLISLCNSDLPKYYPRKNTRFKLKEDTGSQRVVLEDNSWIKNYTEDVSFILKDPVGNRPFCKIFKNGNGACDYKSLSECQKSLDASSFDSTCIENKIGTIVKLAKPMNEQ